MKLPAKYAYLLLEGAPAILVKALELFGVAEIIGAKHNPVIMAWLKELGFDWIRDDETPWCGTAMAVAAVRAGVVKVNANMPRAFWWLDFGVPVAMPKDDKDPNGPSLGDVLIFKSSHVGIYVGEDKTCYHVLGGNQNNTHCIARFTKSSLKAARRTAWKIGQPKNVRRIWLDANGVVATNTR